VRRIAGILLSGFFLAACGPAESPAPGVVIVSARVIDGSGGPSREADVRIAGERIDAVGDIEPAAADRVVDAGGLVLAPGFIDVHSHHDDGLFDMPDALAAVSQGITTIVVGQDGGQPWPLEDFFARLGTSPVAVNVASFAGHGTLRGQVMGDDYRRPATPGEVAAMADLLRAEMEAGALGLSSGLEYDPGSFSTTEEVVALARVAASYGGRYISHVRSEDRYFWEAIDEIIRIGREAGLPVQVTHVKLAMTRWWGQSDRLKARLDAARASGVGITTDIYPYTAWNASFSWLTTLFPERDLDRREGAQYILRDMLSPRFAEIIYNGFWFSPEMDFVQAAFAQSEALIDGQVRLRLLKGNVIPLGRTATSSLYDQELSSMDVAGGYDQEDARGFIRINALRLQAHKLIVGKAEEEG